MMELLKKFSGLTAGQQEQVRNITDAAGLDTFLTSEKITLDEAERAEVLSYIGTGKQPLDDDDLDAVAGGQDTDKNYRAMAYANGRKEPIGISLNHSTQQCSYFPIAEEACEDLVDPRA